ncbi:Pyruvate/Phosphoenolpyruvate kinase-like domain-containing protein [Diplogelasinospora grovesii]|uniref:Pyruvate/Phosphoenolpyruvate kinase-like domain-containing protein n=1 Tax=Diplogelasinospora grovesii TaxID=303347 RepID=A0AAN6N590_9PEZI|nr:Pyruvate/Phosphoenolpyruvate kinase-like domain-containing protein [Diplogelasinospora grovesii]
MRDYMGPTLFQPHRARQAIRDAHEKKIPPLIGYYAGLASVPITRWIAPMGFDYVWIDWEHSACNTETMTTMVHEAAFLSGGRTIPWVRVPGHDHATMAYALDAGACIMVPHVDTVEQAKHVVSGAKFGSKRNGMRSAPPFRLVHGLTDTAAEPERGVWESLNEQGALMIQIETVEGIRNLDAILTEVPDIDAVWLGALDCRVSMGLPAGHGIRGSEPQWLEAAEMFHATVRKHNKPYAGFSFATGDELRKLTANMSMCMVTADTTKLAEMFHELTAAKEALALR